MLLLLFPLLAFATTFGPISVVEQAQHSGYVVHGRVLGAPWMMMDPRVKRPYTYWKLAVLEQPIGLQALSGELNIREPGGEVGDMGYHVAGAASFTADEEVFVTLRDSDDPSTKEIVGLASGKYTVEKDGNGNTKVTSGLGLTVNGNDGKPLSAAEFTALLQRVARHQETAADREIYVNKTPAHDHEGESLHSPSSNSGLAKPAIKQSDPLAQGANKSLQSPKIAQESNNRSEESSTGSTAGLWLLLGTVFFGLVGLVIFLRR
jgi:hypothetical protein